MFRLRKTHRRHRSKSTHSPRLGVELMEGRMMLSATGIESPQPIPEMTQSTLIPVQISFAGAYFNLGPSSPDGGLMLSDTATNVQFDSTIGVTRSNKISLDFNSVDLVTPYAPSRALPVYDSPLLSGTGLKPEVIAASPNIGSLDLTSLPVVIGPSPSTPGISEGGAIPIHAIFADFRKDSQLASGVKAIASSAAETSVASLASARQHVTSDNAIAGEWARAMVFEIAGGEPTNDLHTPGAQPTTTSNSDESLQHSQPLSAVETQQQDGKLATRNAVGQTNEASPLNEMAQRSSDQTDGQFAASERQLLGNEKLTADTSAPITIGQATTENLLTAEHSEAKTFAAAAVFDQLAKGNSAIIDQPVDGRSWLRSIGTSPLLMVLALERIAALNSRRAARVSRIATTNPHRFPG
jgi:hypothetical protein